MDHDQRTHFTTAEAARLLGVKQQTILHAHCVRGDYLGIRPVKLANRLLRWKRADIERLLHGGKGA